MQEIYLSMYISTRTSESQAKSLWSALATLKNLESAEVNMPYGQPARVPFILRCLPKMKQLR
jgi:hypothetical protein